MTRINWTEPRKKRLCDMRKQGYTLQQIADELGCTHAAAQQAAVKYCGKMQNNYTQTEDNYILEWYGTLTPVAIAHDLGRTPESVKSRAHRLGAAKPEVHKPWTDKDIKFLLKFYPIYGAKYCAAHLGRSESSIYAQAYTYGLERVYNKPT